MALSAAGQFGRDEGKTLETNCADLFGSAVSGEVVANLLRRVWRNLPANVRRPAVRWAMQSLRPRVEVDAWFDRSRPWIVVGFLSSPSGLGRATRLAHIALQRQGYDVYGVDLSDAFYEPAGVVPFAFRDGRGFEGAANALININAPYMRYALSLLGARFVRNKAILGYWVWELERAPPDWVQGVDCVHAIAAPSQFAAEAMKPIAPQTPILVIPHPIAIGPLPNSGEPQPGAPFTVNAVMSAASGFVRKNPVGLVRAFRMAFGENSNARLRLRVTNLEHYLPGEAELLEAIGDAPNIEFSSKVLDDEALMRWWGTPHLYASLHRAEGFGLPLAEAMCVGVPVLATDWSANAEYVNESNGYPIKVTLTPVQDPQSKYGAAGRWAEPNIEYAAARFREAASNPDARRAKGIAARESAIRRFSSFEISALYRPKQDLL